MKFFKTYLLILTIIFLSFSCNGSSKDDSNKKKLQAYLLQSLFSITTSPNGESAAKIFYINPAISATNLNLDLVSEATAATVTAGKKKLILIHGWNYNDRDTLSLTISQQKARIITDSWANFITSGAFATTVLKSYDIYAFDYLTSDYVDTNGKRFRSKMDSLFGSESGTVVILAHSMGGIISRFAAYEGTKPAYLKRIITIATPYHGSPWASPQFQESKGVLGDMAAFLADTNGGKDLAWDNFDSKISGASNAKLTTVNAKKDRDDLFYAYYGSVSSSGVSGAGAVSPGLYAICLGLGSKFAPSDCIVPASSAILTGNTLAQTRDLGSYDHYDIKLTTSTMQTTFYNDLP